MMQLSGVIQIFCLDRGSHYTTFIHGTIHLNIWILPHINYTLINLSQRGRGYLLAHVFKKSECFLVSGIFGTECLSNIISHRSFSLAFFSSILAYSFLVVGSHSLITIITTDYKLRMNEISSLSSHNSSKPFTPARLHLGFIPLLVSQYLDPGKWGSLLGHLKSFIYSCSRKNSRIWTAWCDREAASNRKGNQADKIADVPTPSFLSTAYQQSVYYSCCSAVLSVSLPSFQLCYEESVQHVF